MKIAVACGGTGGHIFAETYEQHQRNVARWRQIEKNRSGPSPDTVDRAEADENGSPPEEGSVPSATGAPAAPGAIPSSPTPPASSGAAAPPPGTVSQPTRTNSTSTNGRPRGPAFDASEGTEKDPLRNKTYDLNSPQTVPALREP